MEATSPGEIETFARLLGHMREPVLLVSKTGRIVRGNVAAAEALGTSVAALEGGDLDHFAAGPIGLLEAARGENAFPLRGHDGRRFACDASLLAPDLVVVRLTGPDPSQRAHAFFETAARLERMIASPEARTIDEIARTLLTLGVRSIGARTAGAYLLDETGSTLELTGWIGYDTYALDRYRLVPMDTRMPLTDAVRTVELVLLGTTEDYFARYPEFARSHSYVADYAMACVPLVLDGRCIGGLGLGFTLPWRFSVADRRFLQELGNELAHALDVARRHDANHHTVSERATSWLERLHAFTGALARAHTPAEVAVAVVDAGMAAVGARSGGLWLSSDDATAVGLVRAVGPTGPLPEHHQRVPLDRPSRMPILDAVRSGTPVWIESCAQLEENYPDAFRMLSRGDESSLACVPLLAQGRCIGGVAYNYEGAHRFLEDERAFFQLLSWYAAQALERARLYAAGKVAREFAEASQRRSAFLAETDLLLATLDYQSTLTAVAKTAVPRIADWCIVELDDERRRGMPPVGAHADPAKLPFVLELGRRFREQANPEHGLHAVIETGRSELHRSLTAEQIRARNPDYELAELYAAGGVVSSMVVPISARGRTLGAILLDSADPSRLYDEHDLAMAEDLGRRVGLAVENARLYGDAREADRLKDEFLAMLGHELRNPLAPILSAVELMGLRDDGAFEHERGLVLDNVRHLVRLVDDLLDVSRVIRGKIQLRLERYDTADLIGDAIDIAYPLIEERGHRLSLSAPPRRLPIVADRVRMTQVLVNLLTNAAKYTEIGGEITVSARAEGDEVVVTVRDTGIGITSDMLPRVFDLFMQAPVTLDRASSGLGIGLTVAKTLVGLHDGTITATSGGLGTGSEFTVRLPMARRDVDTPPTPMRVVEPPSMFVGRRVLVVDDNHDAAAVLGELLEAVGCVTRIAYEGYAALATVADFAPEVALVDLGLPQMSGYELARRLRSHDTAIYIVAVTGYARDADRIAALDAGIDEHVVKPVDLAELRRILAVATEALPR